MLDILVELRSDHRQVIDLILALKQALEAGSQPRALRLVEELDRSLGPHMRFEEEHLYPALRHFVGDVHLHQLTAEHGQAADLIHDLKRTLDGERLAPGTASLAGHSLQELLGHVASCEGLSLLIERLPRDGRERLVQELTASRRKRMTLTDWKKVKAPKLS